mgnify:CR=1 FL=1
MDGMPGTSTRGARKRRTGRERTDLWKRVGAFVRERREVLGLSQGDIIRVLGYKSRLCDASHKAASCDQQDYVTRDQFLDTSYRLLVT